MINTARSRLHLFCCSRSLWQPIAQKILIVPTSCKDAAARDPSLCIATAMLEHTSV